jgi:hypothetical protein
MVKDCYEWWYMPIIPALRRLRDSNFVFNAKLGYIARPCLKKSKKKIWSKVIIGLL